jgi:hypothetical protein
MRNVIVLRRPDAHVLGILGVRFIISDTELTEPFQLMMTEHTHKDEVLFLYEVPEVNLGTAAPTEIEVAKGFDEAVDRLTNVTFDAKRSVIVFDSTIAHKRLHPVHHAEVLMIPGGFSVEARSSGTSLLVLPFEFSRCLQIDTVADDIDPPRLFRVNAIETGVLFSRHLTAKIKYFTGLFHNSGCRVRDAQDFSELLATR